MSKRLLLTLLLIIFSLAVAFSVFWVRNQKQDTQVVVEESSSSSSAFAGLVARSEPPEWDAEGYKFDYNYNFNLSKDAGGILVAVSGNDLIIQRVDKPETFYLDPDKGFLLFCLPRESVSSDGTVIDNSMVFLDYSKTSEEDKIKTKKESMNLSFEEKVKFLINNGVTKRIDFGRDTEDVALVESIYLYVDDVSVCK